VVTLGKGLAEALRSLAAAGSTGTWTTTMVDDYHVQTLKLEALGLVKLKPRLITRGKFRGETRGYDVVVTPAGRRVLKAAP
jgi:hypothetical protein